ncbi:MAG: 50S ribosomal protein L23 [Eubacteriales bacterium]|jgi:large subunit ribosomal protein L23|nr:50S ribosomal protein L23 [Eubacteriales bacterium]MDD3072871.1 50S ribosomal protein L23 [Eubacteriales bacterium]MDD4078301.1 50S ribosomal protein L23 [Eubacteriales bacterium]MDD4768172.1 50S ribosomal protein L23 [Eubacteriales bacterium]HBI55979.1 50S ribosomal protein L23 [Bacillota bacterium]
MRDPRDILIRPVITEKTNDLMADKKYTFVVKRDANKIEIAHAVEKIFKVQVESVTTANMRGKLKRMGVHEGYRPSWKKAVVSLTANSKPIEIFE